MAGVQLRICVKCSFSHTFIRRLFQSDSLRLISFILLFFSFTSVYTRNQVQCLWIGIYPIDCRVGNIQYSVLTLTYIHPTVPKLFPAF